jgi:hypothetical protein
VGRERRTVITKTKTPVVYRHEVRADPQQIDRAKRIVERGQAAIQAGIFCPSIAERCRAMRLLPLRQCLLRYPHALVR